MTKLINRPSYIKQLIDNKDIDLIKIVTGVRRCGKSSILDLFHEYLIKENVPKENIIHLNLESIKYNNIKNYLSFYNYVSQLIPKSGKTYLIFDELQVVKNWEKAIESFRIDYNVDIYITGSNAYLLSGEFSTYLSGRYIEIPVLPLSFKEFLSFYRYNDSISKEEKFQNYLKYGGMPIIKEYKLLDNRIKQVLEGIYSTVIIKDIALRNPQIDLEALNKLVLFLCSNIGNINSPNSIGNTLSIENKAKKLKDENIAGKTVEKYMNLLEKSFIFYNVRRYDIKGKNLLKTLGKTYIVDLSFRNLLLGYRDTDRGHILENIVFLELIRRGYNVYIGKVGEYEVDFLAEKPTEKIYIQVCESLGSEELKNRELRSLKLIRDNYEKIVLSMDRSFASSYDGIKIINLIDWLLD